MTLTQNGVGQLLHTNICFESDDINNGNKLEQINLIIRYKVCEDINSFLVFVTL